MRRKSNYAFTNKLSDRDTSQARTSNYNVLGDGLDKTVRKRLTAKQVAFYANRLGPKLKALLEQITTDAKGLELDEELQSARLINSVNEEVFAEVYENVELCGVQLSYEQRIELLKQAGSNAMHGNEVIAGIAAKYSQIIAATAGKMTPHVANLLIQQVLRFAHVVWGEDEDGMLKFEKLLDEELELPTLDGTTRTAGATYGPSMADAQAAAMDATIPVVPEPGAE